MRNRLGNSSFRISLSTFDLKCIALLTMLIDHIGLFLFPGEIWMRYIGRLSFPIFAFLIVEGYVHTRNVKKYMVRLGLFAVISEIPYDLVRTHQLIDWNTQNVFFTLFLGLACVAIWNSSQHLLLKGAFFLAVAAASHYLIKANYGIGGIAMILCFFWFREPRYWVERVLSIGALNVCLYGPIQAHAIWAFLPLGCYNGEKGPSVKYLFYLFYPLHLLILYLIWRLNYDIAV
ncbi:MAG: hypothetical protein J6B28_02600 [Eubacterium sp.]|nr:hypothetical protein [Eubacterium sp.]